MSGHDIVVATGDWHMDWRTAGLSRFDDVRRGAEQAVDKAIELRADLFAFLGDLADPDSPAAWRAAAFAIECWQRLDEHRIKSVWLTGNHDVLEDGSGTSVLEPLRAAGAEVAALPTFHVGERLGLDVIALPYVARSHAYDPAEEIRKAAGWGQIGRRPLVLGHLMAEGISVGSETGDMARGRDVFLPLEQLAASYPEAIIVNGHYHLAQEFRGVRFPGALARLTRGERDHDPQFLVLEVPVG